jgi:hypothetical protein
MEKWKLLGEMASNYTMKIGTQVFTISIESLESSKTNAFSRMVPL